MAISPNLPPSITQSLLTQLVEVAVGDLVTHPGNPRRGRVDLIAQSLERYGQYRPVVARRDDRAVLVGNHMLRAARQLGWTSVQVLYVNLSEDEAKQLLVWDNRTSDLAENDTEALIELLESLDGLDGTGYDQGDLDELLEELAPPPLAPEDVAPVPVVPRTRPGEVLDLGAHRLICADATDPASWRALLGHERPDAMWTDPPYGVEYEGRTSDRLRIANDRASDVSGLLIGAFSMASDVLAPGAPVYTCAPAGPLMMEFLMAFVAAGFSLRQTLVWVKDSMVLGHSDYQYRHEPILYGYTSSPGAGRLGRGGAGWFGDRRQTSVLEVDRPRASREHPTMKPPELIEIALGNSTRRGALIVDPFAGSGSTLVACERMGRRARLIELDPGYCDVVIARYEALTGVHVERGAA
jgi:DNA modification methylase